MTKIFASLPVHVIVILVILGVLFGLWLIAILFAVIFSSVFGHKIKSGNKAINLLLNQRFEISKSMVKMLQNAGVEIEKNSIETIMKFDHVEDFQKIEKIMRDSLVLNFVHVSHSIFLLLDVHASKFNEEEYKNLRQNYLEVEELYRQKSAVYNADAIGYNYWISIASAL